MNEAIILEKLDAILDALDTRDSAVLTVGHTPPDHPEVRLSEIDPATIGGEHIQLDGSTWVYDQGVPVGRIYGYISQNKDPALWDRMCAVVGGGDIPAGDVKLRGWLAANGALARYAAHPMVALGQGAASYNLLAYLLSNPLPPTAPTVPVRG